VKVGPKNEVVLGTFLEVDFKLLVVVSGSYETVHKNDCWHGIQGT
jgi:hypothetical protein